MRGSESSESESLYTEHLGPEFSSLIGSRFFSGLPYVTFAETVQVVVDSAAFCCLEWERKAHVKCQQIVFASLSLCTSACCDVCVCVCVCACVCVCVCVCV